jgi:hypothetical protein
MAPSATVYTGIDPQKNLNQFTFAQVLCDKYENNLTFIGVDVNIIVWSGILAVVIFVAYVAVRMAARGKDDDSLRDTGFAIIEFNRAFPNEAIRQLQATADGQVVFVRLHDNKAGFMRSMLRHFSCHVLEPGRVRVVASETGQGLVIDFLDHPHHNGTFEFASAQEASEVSLWLLGNYVAEPDIILPPPENPAANNH